MSLTSDLILQAKALPRVSNNACDAANMPLGKRLKWPTWPEPEQSIGRAFGAIPKTRFSYWQAIGPALAAYQALLPDIRRVLSKEHGPIPNSDFVWFSIYTVGPCSSSAVPYVMFASEQKQRRRALKLVRDSKILSRYPGMQAGEWAEAYANHVRHSVKSNVETHIAILHPTLLY
jgi:hypothetical protein